MKLSLATLTRLYEQGHDPTKVVEQSIENTWTGLFPVRPTDGAKRNETDQRRHAGNGGTLADRVSEANGRHDDREGHRW